MKIDEMPAGRDMDALVAEKVMEWTEVGCEKNEKHTEYVPFGLPPGIAPNRKMPYMVRRQLPCFSTEIAAAWEVVQKMRLDGWWVHIVQDNTDIWDVKFWKGEPKWWFPTVEHYGYGDTAPLAICRAALKSTRMETV